VKHRAAFAIGVILAGIGFGCRATNDTSASPPAPAPSVGATTSQSPSAPAILDELDKRVPVPLLPMMAKHQKENMRDHLAVVQEVIAAIGAKDFTSIQRSVSRIGYSEQMGQMCSHMGAGAPGFSEQAIGFHRNADKIGEAAKKHDMDAVLLSLNETLAACTACHARFKQQVVDDAAWTNATKMAAPNAPVHSR